MNKDYENVLEDLALVYRLKQQAEAHKKESDALLEGTRVLLTAEDEQDLYKKMFSVFKGLYNYQVCFVLENESAGKMRCINSTHPPLLNTVWQIDDTLSRAVKSEPIALFNIKQQATWQRHLSLFDTPVTSVLYCPFKVHQQHAVIVFCHQALGYYTQEFVDMANRYRTFTEQMAMGMQAKLMALETVRLKEEKAIVEKSLIDSEKMASLGLLAAGVAHEINNPVAFINSNIHFLRNVLPALSQMQDIVLQLAASATDDERLKVAEAAKQWKVENKIDSLSDEIADICSESEEGLNRVTDIITSLRSFTHDADIPDDETVNVNDCIAHALRLVNSELKHRIKIQQHLSDVPLIKGKTGKLNQVLVNLFVNAAQAMEDGDKLTISSFEEKDHTVITVKDTGCGIEKHALQKLFEPFYTTKPTGKGTGLGLYISFSIVEAMGGTISVESEVNVGTTFTLSFPTKLEDKKTAQACGLDTFNSNS
ncbi:ATP-binding protein [Alteromonas sp. CNT1-28]|uniref:sensor histidine kinase n=1 Tax=Alteromonas sp. CNT1-28 TaxID=2917730 RepID=UPI001EF33DCB|nr:ATP-binding protein [Alteromonas sp. CNT1-28]MCG7638251.1 ATP-binding protein [Alteromonas sp. CNT1-28]